MLVGNGVRLSTSSPMRQWSATNGTTCRASWKHAGPTRNITTAEGWDDLSSIPSGSYPPGVWMLARRAGGISSFGRIDGEGVLTAAGAMGVAAEAALSGAGDLTVEGQLIVSAVAALSGSGALTGDVLAVLQLAADLSGTGDVAGTLGALGNAVAAITGAGALSVVPYATGELEAEITPFAELSPQSLAAAVWDTAVSEYETAGTMGFAQAFLYALGHHRVVTDPAAGTFTVYDTDDTTPLFVADLWENAAGTLPYDGQGSERRDQFA